MTSSKSGPGFGATTRVLARRPGSLTVVEQDRLLAEVSRVLRPGGPFAGTDSIGTGRAFKLPHVHDTLVPISRPRHPRSDRSRRAARADRARRADRAARGHRRSLVSLSRAQARLVAALSCPRQLGLASARQPRVRRRAIFRVALGAGCAGGPFKAASTGAPYAAWTASTSRGWTPQLMQKPR